MRRQSSSLRFWSEWCDGRDDGQPRCGPGERADYYNQIISRRIKKIFAIMSRPDVVFDWLSARWRCRVFLPILCLDERGAVVRNQYSVFRLQPIAGLWPTFQSGGSAAAFGVAACNCGRCAVSYIRPNASTHGPPTSSFRPRQPRKSLC